MLGPFHLEPDPRTWRDLAVKKEEMNCPLYFYPPLIPSLASVSLSCGVSLGLGAILGSPFCLS